MSRYLISPLSSTRSLLSLTGADSVKFLQGLVTNDVASSSQKISSPDSAIYAGFLSAQGRLTHDTFILPNLMQDPKQDGFLIDFPKKVESPLLTNYIKRYILRSKVKLRQTEDTLWAVHRSPVSQEEDINSSTIEEELQHIASTSKGRFWKDTRAKGMGYRLAVPSTGLSVLEGKLDRKNLVTQAFAKNLATSSATSFSSTLPSSHTLLRTLLNVPETPSDLVPNQALPLESNMDLMGGGM